MGAYQLFQEALSLTPGNFDSHQYPIPFNRFISPRSLLGELLKQAVAEERERILKLVREQDGKTEAAFIRALANRDAPDLNDDWR